MNSAPISLWSLVTASPGVVIRSPIASMDIRHLHAPLGIWGCNGNITNIYARAEDEAAYLYAQAGMKLVCARKTHKLLFKGAPFNLIGIDLPARTFAPRPAANRPLPVCSAVRPRPRDMINMSPRAQAQIPSIGLLNWASSFPSQVIPTADRYRSKSSTIA